MPKNFQRKKMPLENEGMDFFQEVMIDEHSSAKSFVSRFKMKNKNALIQTFN